MQFAIRKSRMFTKFVNILPIVCLKYYFLILSADSWSQMFTKYATINRIILFRININTKDSLVFT